MSYRAVTFSFTTRRESLRYFMMVFIVGLFLCYRPSHKVYWPILKRKHICSITFSPFVPSIYEVINFLYKLLVPFVSAYKKSFFLSMQYQFYVKTRLFKLKHASNICYNIMLENLMSKITRYQIFRYTLGYLIYYYN